MTLLSIFFVFWFVGGMATSGYAGYKTGESHIYMQALSPQPFQVNWVNNFFQTLLWPSYWLAVYGEHRARQRGSITQNQAAAFLKLPIPPRGQNGN